MSDTDASLTSSDETLIADARSGDQNAFAELWRRHYRSGARVARQFTSSIDADDLVSEAYTRIYQRVLAGGGPSGAFRPYLYTTIRNLASSWGAASRDVQVDDISDFEDPSSLDDPAAIALDRTLTARAFRSLPERWQSVLWYTEVEGMDPHEVAPLLGMSANGVAALSYRAREGLRKAWLQAHVSQPGASEACKWTMARLGEAARHSLTPREQEKINEHLLTCAKCAIVSEEVEEVGSHLAMVLLPILLGGAVGGAILSTLGHAGVAAAATAVPAVPASFTVLAAPAAFAPAVSSGLAMGAATGVSALVGGLAVAATIGGSVVLGLAPTQATHDSPQQVASSQQASAQHNTAPDPTKTPVSSVIGDLSTPTPLPTDIVGPLGGTTKDVLKDVTKTVGNLNTTVHKAVKDVDKTVAPIVNTVKQTSVVVELNGRGMPGATVSAKAGGVVYGTATIKPNGTWAIHVAALPGSTSTLQVQQTLRVLGVTVPITIPLSLNNGGLKVVVQLLN